MNGHQLAEEGIKLVKLNKIIEGLSTISQAIDLEPLNPEIYNLRGIIYLDLLKDYNNAITDFTRSIELNSNNYEFHYNLANVYLDTKQFELAILHYSRAIELNPHDPDLFSNRGNCYLQLKQFENSIFDYKKAIEMNPNDNVAKFIINKLGQ